MGIKDFVNSMLVNYHGDVCLVVYNSDCGKVFEDEFHFGDKCTYDALIQGVVITFYDDFALVVVTED